MKNMLSRKYYKIISKEKSRNSLGGGDLADKLDALELTVPQSNIRKKYRQTDRYKHTFVKRIDRHRKKS